MDDDRRRRRQDEGNPPPSYRYAPGMQSQTAQQQQQLQQQQQQEQQRRAWTARASMDRYQPGPLNTSASAMTSRDMGTSAAYSDPYYQGSAGSSYPPPSIPQGTLAYQQTSGSYGQPDARQSQHYPSNSYQSAAAMMYNVPQGPNAQNPQVYDASQQYPSRAPAGLPIINPDVAGHHYYQGGPANVSAAAPAMQSQPGSSSTSQAVYQQPSSLQNYPNMTSMGGMTPQTSATADMSMEEPALPTEDDPSESFEHYESTLREAIREIRDSDLATASDTLLTASSLLRDGVVRFGLVSDDSRARADRISIWRDFNNAWLALLQRQKDMVESHQQLGQSQSLLSLEGLRNMGKTVIDMCDVLEKHGLVDYEMGMWEERIVDILGECMDLYERPEATSSSPN